MYYLLYTWCHRFLPCSKRLAKVAVVAVALAVVLAMQIAVLAVHVVALEPAVQGLVDVVEVLGQAVSLALGAAGVLFRDALVAVEAGAGGEPAVVGANGLDRVTAVVVEARAEDVRAAVDVVLDGELAALLAVLAVGRVALHKAGGGTALVGVA